MFIYFPMRVTFPVQLVFLDVMCLVTRDVAKFVLYDIIRQRLYRKTDSRSAVAKMSAFCLTRPYLTVFTSPGNKTAPTRSWQLTFITRGIVPRPIYYDGPLLVPYLRKSQYSLLICIANLLTYLVCSVYVICLACDWLLMKSLLVNWRLSLVFSRVTIHNWN